MKKPAKLTPHQRKLLEEVKYISSITKMELDAFPDHTLWRTVHLQGVRNKLIRSEVVTQYTLIDEHLTSAICHFLFSRPKVPFHFGTLWKTKKFRLFNHYIMDEMYVLQKARLVHAISPLSKRVRDHIERINAARNSLTHSFFSGE